MKSKLSIKVLGIVVALATLASLVVGLTAAPVSAAANTSVFTPYSLPSNIGNFLGGVSYSADLTARQTSGGVFTYSTAITTDTTSVVISNPHLNAVTASPDGNTIYAWDNTNQALYESTNGGKSFPNTIGINTDTTATFIGMECSPKFATDGSVVLVTSKQVWLITGGVSSAVAITGDLTTKLEGGTITSFDVGPYYATGQLAIVIGVSGGAGAYSNVLLFLVGGYTWQEVGATSTAAGNGYMKTADVGRGAFDPSVIAVKFDNNYQSDAAVMAVYTQPAAVGAVVAGTYLACAVAAGAWNSAVLNSTLVLASTPNATEMAVINVGTDYFVNSTGIVLVGLQDSTGGSTANGLFIVKNWISSSTVSEITPTSSPASGISTAVSHIAVSGPLATAYVVVSSPGTTALNISSNVLASPPTWVTGATYRAATGSAITSLCYTGTNNAKLLVSTTAATDNGTQGSAVNLSTDNGNTFNQIGIIDIGANLNLTYKSFAMLSNTNWYIRISGGIYQSPDMGASWVRIFAADWGGNSSGSGVSKGMARSLTFATDNTFILYNDTTLALITSNGGQTYSPIGAPINIGGLSMIENGAYYMYSDATVLPTPTTAAFYLSGRYVNATFPTGMGVINSVARSAADTTHMTYAIGTTNGQVLQSTDGGVTFAFVGTGPGSALSGSTTLGDLMTVSYTSDGTLWAVPTGSQASIAGAAKPVLPIVDGIFFWNKTTSQWQNINMTRPVNGWAIAADGTAYAAGDFGGMWNAAAGTQTGPSVYGAGIYRCLNYNAKNADGSSAAVWGYSPTINTSDFVMGDINQYTFPNGSVSATLGASSTGYPGGTSGTIGIVSDAITNSISFSTGLSVAASGATGNTLYFTENTSIVANSGAVALTSPLPVPFPATYGSAIYSFVDAYTAGPTVVAPKDGTVLTSDLYATMTWNPIAGPAGGANPYNTNYMVKLSTSKDFTGSTTPVYTAGAGLDVYTAGNTIQSVGVNPPVTTSPLTANSLQGGTQYYWQVMAISPLPSRATVAGFTTALSAVNPAAVAVNPVPANGATGVPVSNTTFTWPSVTGATGYQFVLADSTANTSANEFAIIDYSANTPTNAEVLQETLKYNNVYWWEVRATTATSQSAWTILMFTTMQAPVATTATTATAAPTTTMSVIVPTVTATPTTVVVTNTGTTSQPIPSYLLWAVIAVGAVLVIAVIVLIVRTRRMP